MTPVDGNIWEIKKHVVPCDPVVAPYPKSGESSLADAKCSIWSLWLTAKFHISLVSTVSCRVYLCFSTQKIEWLWTPPRSFLYLSLMHSLPCLYACMLSTPVITDIQNKGILIFDLVAPSNSAGHSSDLPVCSALFVQRFHPCRCSPFPSVFLHQR